MSGEVKNYKDNSELIEYLKIRKEAQTEIEIKNIMPKIYESIITNSNLFYTFSSSIPPQIGEDGSEIFETTAIIKPALIYSEKAMPYLPLYTTIEESEKRETTEQYPYMKALEFNEYVKIIENEKIDGIVINPFSDNLILNKSKILHLLNSKNGNDLQNEEKKSEEKNEEKSLESSSSAISFDKKKKGILVNEYDMRILEYNILPSRVVKVAINFAKQNSAITALWVFDKRYYLPNDNAQYLGQLIVVEDNLENDEEKEKLYSELKEVVLPQSNASEVFVESIENQKHDFVRKNVVIPFYQKVNVFGEYEKEA